MPRRRVHVLALVAALLWAPSTTFAASNGLSDATASPLSGPVGTSVRLTVHYEGKFAAVGIIAQVAGLSVPMVRASGTATSGTWAVVVVPPAGRWPVSFTATVTKGAPATLTGPTVTIGAAPLPSTGTSAPSAGDGSPIRLPPGPVATAPPAAPAPAASSAPAGSAAPAPAPATGPETVSPSTAPGGGTSPVAPGDAPSAPVDGGPAANGESRPSADPAPHGAAGPSRAPEGGAPTPQASIAEPSGPAGESTDDAIARAFVLLGLLGLTTIGLLGSTLLTTARRRRERPSEEIADEQAAVILDQRSRRRGRVRLPDDPIIAALGVGDAQRPRRPRRRPTSPGPGSDEPKPPNRAR